MELPCIASENSIWSYNGVCFIENLATSLSNSPILPSFLCFFVVVVVVFCNF